MCTIAGEALDVVVPEIGAIVSELVAVTSIGQIVSGTAIDRMSFVPMLKRAAILCDRIYFETFGLGDPGGDYEQQAINAAFGGLIEGRDLAGDKRFADLLLLPQHFGDDADSMLSAAIVRDGPSVYYEATQEYVDGLPDEDLEPLAKPWRGVDYKVRGAMALELESDLARPLALRKWIDEPVGLLAPAHREVLKLAMAADRSSLDIMQELAVQTLFDFGSLTWDEILKLRKSPRISDFRYALSKMELLPPGEVQSAWRREVEELAETTRPSPVKTLLSGFMGNLPLGDANPFGAAQPLTDYFREDERSRKYSWLYFVMDARSKQREKDS